MLLIYVRKVPAKRSLNLSLFGIVNVFVCHLTNMNEGIVVCFEQVSVSSVDEVSDDVESLQGEVVVTVLKLVLKQISVQFVLVCQAAQNVRLSDGNFKLLDSYIYLNYPTMENVGRFI